MSSSDTHDDGRLDFQTVYGEFQAKIRRYLNRLVGTTDGEDLTQETFAKVSQALPQFRGDSSLSTWIYRIATNAAYDRLRRRSADRTRDVPTEDHAVVDEHASGIEQTLVRRAMNDCIDEFIARLPPSHRSVLVLSEQEELTNQEIADALGLTLETVKIRLHRARARLRNELGSGCDFYRDDRNEFACEPKRADVSLKDRPPSTPPRTGGQS
jgi:RNA polymerase sigma-70 factor (ECF subfamily)